MYFIPIQTQKFLKLKLQSSKGKVVAWLAIAPLVNMQDKSMVQWFGALKKRYIRRKKQQSLVTLMKQNKHFTFFYFFSLSFILHKGTINILTRRI